MSKGDVGHLGRHMGTIILHSDDTGVQRLPLPVGVELALFTNAPGASCGGSSKGRERRYCQTTQIMRRESKSP